MKKFRESGTSCKKTSAKLYNTLPLHLTPWGFGGKAGLTTGERLLIGSQQPEQLLRAIKG